MIARLLTGAAPCLPLWAGAHDFWVNPDRFVVAVGASTALRMQVGHGDARRTPPGNWLLNVMWTTPLSGEGIDFDTVFSSLSFAVPK